MLPGERGPIGNKSLSKGIGTDGAEDRRRHLWRGTMRKIAGLLGAAAALATVSGANATGVQGNAQNPATSYRNLLNPVANALDALKADDARLANTPADAVKLAQIGIVVGHHHHHHHHARARVIIVPPHRRSHHHHHHHHHSSYYGR
jgi:hypothetical protein